MAVITSIILFIFSLLMIFNTEKIGGLFDDCSTIAMYLSLFAYPIDIFIQMNTAVLEKGELNEDKTYIRMHYFSRRLLLDILSLLPIVDVVGDHFFGLSGDSLTYLNFLILLKLPHFWEVLQRLDYFFTHHKDHKNTMDLVKLFFLILSSMHVIALLWYRLAVYEKEKLNETKTWLDLIKVSNLSFIDTYFYSFYFAMVTTYTIGYGDITPQTVIECNFVTVVILITGLIFVYAIN